MRATTVAVLPVRLTAALGVLLAGCVQVPQSPDSDYRQAFEKALVVGRCDGSAVKGMWAAYGRWYAVASAIPGHDKTDEATALLRQGDRFHVIGCPEVARASYTALLRRFPEIDFTPLRDSARVALGNLPPPPVVPNAQAPAPVPAAPVSVHPAAGRI